VLKLLAAYDPNDVAINSTGMNYFQEREMAGIRTMRGPKEQESD
jgi:hypothetical protein